jgi:hypothetical protein
MAARCLKVGGDQALPAAVEEARSCLGDNNIFKNELCCAWQKQLMAQAEP